MPTKKNSKATPKNSKEKVEETSTDSSVSNEVVSDNEDLKDDSVSSVKDTEANLSKEEKGGQLFFSTDGAEPEKSYQNPFIEEKSTEAEKPVNSQQVHIQ